MSFHAILALTCPTDANTKKARITEEIITMAEVVFAKGMLIPEDKEELEEEQEMWTVWWEHQLVHAGALWINWELTRLQDLLQVSLQKGRDHRMEPWVASHVVTKMEEAYPLCARWKTEVAAWHERCSTKDGRSMAGQRRATSCPVRVIQTDRITQRWGSIGQGKREGKSACTCQWCSAR